MANKDFVVVNIKNSQEMVSVGDTIEVNKIEGDIGSKLKFDEVFLSVKGDKTSVGKPIVAKSSVEAEIVEQFRGEKIHTRIYKAKARYRKHTGQRADMTKLKIIDIKF